MSAIDGAAKIIWSCLKRLKSNSAKRSVLSKDEIELELEEPFEMLQDIDRMSTFMLSAINRCQDCSKVNHGVKLIPNSTTFNLKRAMNNALKLFGKPVYSQGKVRLLPFPKFICSHIISDEQWLQENLICLISNALKYSPSGHITVKVCFYPVQIPKSNLFENMLCFEVEDRGVGVPKEKQSQLFAPFKQAQRHAGGTGLGLYSLAERVKALDGEYGVSDRHDKESGARFWFTLPYRPDHEAASMDMEEKLASTLQKVGGGNPGESSPLGQSNIYSAPSCDTVTSSYNDLLSRPLRILVVDDSEFILKMTCRMLIKAGHTVAQAVNGAEALRTLDECKEEFDLIIMDLNMPVLDGLETIRRIRSKEIKNFETLTKTITSSFDDPYFDFLNGGVLFDSKSSDFKSHSFIIGCSGNDDVCSVQETLEAGADGFISKPFHIESLFNCLSKLPQKVTSTTCSQSTTPEVGSPRLK